MRITRIAALSLTVALLAVEGLMGGSAAHAAAKPKPHYRTFVQPATGKCMSTEKEGGIYLIRARSCTAKNKETKKRYTRKEALWQVIKRGKSPSGHVLWQLKNKKNGQCLTSTHEGAFNYPFEIMTTRKCTKANMQKWEIFYTGKKKNKRVSFKSWGYYKLLGVHVCVQMLNPDAEEDESHNVAQLQPCDIGKNAYQRWKA